MIVTSIVENNSGKDVQEVLGTMKKGLGDKVSEQTPKQK